MDQTTTSSEKMPRTLVALGSYLILITALVRLGTSLYLPALPRMGIELALSTQQLAHTMTAYFIGFAVASIFLGPVSDHWGRRILIQGGLVVYLLGSLFCAVAQEYGLLLTGRILQAVGGSAIPVATRAMIRDAYDDRQMIGVLGWIGSITALVPVLAPVLGGLMTQGFGWRSNFYVLTIATLLICVFARIQAPETLPHEKRMPLRLTDPLRVYGAMILTPSFMLPLIPIMLCFALQGAYLVSSPFIFIHLLNLSPAVFGTTSLVLVGGLVAGRFVCVAALKRWHAPQAFAAGAALTFLGGLLFLLILLFQWISVFSILAASAVFCLGFGTLLPIGMKAGLSAFPDRVGTASALFGCLTLGATAAGSALLGTLMERSMQDIFVLGICTFAAGSLILLSSLLSRRSIS
jgi:DHA1 family bicyclomycin/chloramphenicol resistance-like MFS transporter